jgi:hypothetical protein
LCVWGAAQSNVAAQYTVKVGPPPAGERAVQVPRIEMVAGKPTVKLGIEENGLTMRIPVGTFILLKFPGLPGAISYTIYPPHGVLESPSGVYHLPKDVIGVVQATNKESATITVRRVVQGTVGDTRGSLDIFLELRSFLEKTTEAFECGGWI